MGTIASEGQRGLRKNWFIIEALQLFKLTLPTLLGYLFQQLIFLVSLTFCGHVTNSSIVLESVGLAQSIIDILGLSVVFGFGTALDTLASQAWGAKNYKKVGVYFQRALLIHMLLMGLVLALCFNAETILNLLQQPPQVVKLTTQYVWLFSIALPAVYPSVLIVKYFEAQNVVFPLIIPGLIANIVNAIAHYLLMFVLKLGVVGAGISVVLAEYTTLICLLIIIYVRKLHVKTWGGWSRECLNGWGQFAMLGIPGLFMVVVEMLSFEIGYYVSGSLGVVQQSIQSVAAAYVYLVFMFPMSLSVGISIRVGNELGAGDHRRAKRAAFVGLVIDAAWIATVLAITASLSSYLPRIFTSDPTVLQAMGPVMLVIAGLVSVDSLQGYLGGILRGSGKQLIGAAGNLFSYWMVGVPLGIVLAIVVHMGTLGYWVGLLAGDFLQAVIYSIIVLTLRWKKEAEKAQKLLTEEQDESKLKRKLPSNAINESTPLIQDDDNDVSSDYSTVSRSNAKNNHEVDEKVEVHPPASIWRKDEVEESLVENSSDSHKGNPSPALKIARSTVVLRVVTCTVFALFLLFGAALSQLCVYSCTLVPNNGTNLTNGSGSAAYMAPPMASNGTSHRECSWDFLHPLTFTLEY